MINVAIVGVGNCASALIQGVEYYRNTEDTTGLMFPLIGKYKPGDIEFVAAFDVDDTKVGFPLNEAIRKGQNNTYEISHSTATCIVMRGPMMDGMGETYHEKVNVAEGSSVDIVQVLKDSKADVLVNYLPVGAEILTRHYAECALQAGVAFANCIPVFIATNPTWQARYKKAGIPLVGDDIKSQVGATIVHRALAQLMTDRGYKVTQTYQLNVGGNMDFYNMLSTGRLTSKKTSKTGAVQTALKSPLDDDKIHIGPSDYVPFLKDRKVAFIRLEGLGWGGVPMNIELRLEVWDSPNSAGVVVDAIRHLKVALDNGVGGALTKPSAYLMKSPPIPMDDRAAYLALQETEASDCRCNEDSCPH